MGSGWLVRWCFQASNRNGQMMCSNWRRLLAEGLGAWPPSNARRSSMYRYFPRQRLQCGADGATTVREEACSAIMPRAVPAQRRYPPPRCIYHPCHVNAASNSHSNACTIQVVVQEQSYTHGGVPWGLPCPARQVPFWLAWSM